MKRVLIISYHWPPSGGVGVLRCLKFSKYLRLFGWEPIVYAPSNASYLLYDHTNFQDIQPDIKLLSQPIWEPFRLFKLLSGREKDDPTDPVHVKQKKSIIDNFAIWVRGNFFIPDARCRWINPSVRYLKSYLKEHPVDAIFTDGPPHTNTMIGMRLSTELGIPWLADFQDPWTQADYYKLYKIMWLADKQHHRLEQQVFKNAHKITIASPSWAKDIERIGAQNADVIYYGYDEEDFNNMKQSIDADFTIAHAGQLSWDRNPEVLFQVLKELKNELPEFDKKLKLKFAGNIDISVKEAIAQNCLQENFTDLGFISRKEAIQLTLNAQLLLLPLNKAENVDGRIPGKLFENLRALRPILCLGPQQSDAAMIIEKCKAGVSIEYDDRNQLKSYIRERYILYLNGENHATTFGFEFYTNKNQTKILSDFLTKITQ
jgi:glycosyltransferase involved in cell wall biosynthesis